MSEGTDETGFPESKRPRTSELPATPSSEREVLGLLDSSETMPPLCRGGRRSMVFDDARLSTLREVEWDFRHAGLDPQFGCARLTDFQ